MKTTIHVIKCERCKAELTAFNHSTVLARAYEHEWRRFNRYSKPIAAVTADMCASCFMDKGEPSEDEWDATEKATKERCHEGS